MATTNTITEPVPGTFVHKYTALAAGDTATIQCIGADLLLVQVVSVSSIGDSVISLLASIDGTTFDGAIPLTDPASGLAATNGGITATAATGVMRVQQTGYLRLSVSGTTGTGIVIHVLVQRRASL